MATNADIIAHLDTMLSVEKTTVMRVQILQALATANLAEELRLKRESN